MIDTKHSTEERIYGSESIFYHLKKYNFTLLYIIMSRHTVDEKYKKYLGLLQKEPLNTLYKRKLQKYKAMASKSVQRGGMGSDQNSKRNSTSDLINKITNMLAQQNRPSTGTKDSRKHKTYIKGGADGEGEEKKEILIDFSDAGFNAENIISQNKLGLSGHDFSNRLAEVGKITGENSLIADTILAGVGRLKAEKDRISAELTAINAKVADLEQQYQEKNKIAVAMTAEIEKLRGEKATLEGSCQALIKGAKNIHEQKKITTKVGNNKQLEARIKELTERSEVQIKNLEDNIAELQQNLDDSKEQEAQCKEQHKTISELLSTTETRANELLAKVAEKDGGIADKFREDIEGYIQQLNALHEKLTSIENQLPKGQVQAQ
jgi:chromosome segregation ATPase